MKKMKTIFIKNPDDMSKVLQKKEQSCDWVFEGECRIFRKYNGTCCKIDKGIFYKRRTVRKGKYPPPDFILEDFDSNTGKSFGWVFVTPNDKYHLEAFDDDLEDGTYELVGPKIQGNAEDYYEHTLIKHDECQEFINIPLDFDGLKEWFRHTEIEGLVFHHKDGRKAKIRKSDF